VRFMSPSGVEFLIAPDPRSRDNSEPIVRPPTRGEFIDGETGRLWSPGTGKRLKRFLRTKICFAARQGDRCWMGIAVSCSWRMQFHLGGAAGKPSCCELDGRVARGLSSNGLSGDRMA